MSILEAVSFIASLVIISAGLASAALLVKDEVANLHRELRYINGKTNRLIQLSRLTLEPVEEVRGEPIVLSELTDDDWNQIYNLLYDAEGGAV